MNGRSCCRKTNFFYHHIPAYSSTLCGFLSIFLSLSLQLTYILSLPVTVTVIFLFLSLSPCHYHCHFPLPLSLSSSRSLSASSQSHLISHSLFFSLVPYIFLSPTLSSHIFFTSGVTMAFAESLAFGCLMNKFSPDHIPGLRGLPVG